MKLNKQKGLILTIVSITSPWPYLWSRSLCGSRYKKKYTEKKCLSPMFYKCNNSINDEQGS